MKNNTKKHEKMEKWQIWEKLLDLNRIPCDDDTEAEKQWKLGWNEALKAAITALDVDPF